MESYYSNQASHTMPYFSGHYRQRGSGFGALAAGIGRVALPLARKIIWPAAKRIGRELISQGAPELVDLVTKKQSAKQALRNTVRKTAKNNWAGPIIAKEDTRKVGCVNELIERKDLRRSFPQKVTTKEAALISSLA